MSNVKRGKSLRIELPVSEVEYLFLREEQQTYTGLVYKKKIEFKVIMHLRCTKTEKTKCIIIAF